MSLSTPRPAVLLALAALPSAACLPYDVTERPVAPVETPEGFASGGEEVAAQAGAGDREGVDAEPWWRSLGDPRLTVLCEKALERSFTLRAGWARVAQARALAVQAGAPLWPEVNVTLSAGRQRSIFGAFGAQEFSNFGASLPVSWELDLPSSRRGRRATTSRRWRSRSRRRSPRRGSTSFKCAR
jgi:outer membrane protein TolC